MGELPSISDAEMHIMSVLWEASPLTAAQVDAQLSAQTGWHRKTVNTLIGRLLAKGAVSFEPHRSGRRYFPLIAREDYSQAATNKLVNRLYGGRLAPLVAHFAEQQPLSAQDIEALKKIIDELSDD